MTDSTFPIYCKFWINVSELVLSNIIPSATLLFPGNNTEVQILNPKFEWTASDVNGDAVTCDIYYSKILENVQTLNAGIKIGSDLAVRAFTATSPLEKGATYYWTVIPYDGEDHGVCTSGIWTFTISESANVNHAPKMEKISDRTITAGEMLTIQVVATDADGDGLTFALETSVPGLGAGIGNSGLIDWQTNKGDAGTYSFIVTVSDKEISTSQTFNVTVRSPVTPDDDDSEGISVYYYLMAGLIAFIILIVIIVVIILVFVNKKKRNMNETTETSPEILVPEKGREDLFMDTQYVDSYVPQSKVEEKHTAPPVTAETIVEREVPRLLPDNNPPTTTKETISSAPIAFSKPSEDIGSDQARDPFATTSADTTADEDQQDVDSALKALKDLNALKQSGAISNEEYEASKRRLLRKI